MYWVKDQRDFPPPEVERGTATVEEYMDFTGFQKAAESKSEDKDDMQVLRGDDEWLSVY